MPFPCIANVFADVCRAGLRLANNGKTCVDIDECAEQLADCTQQCVNKDPRKSGVPYSCSCDLGFSLNLEDRHQCVKTVGSTLPVISQISLFCCLLKLSKAK